MVLLMGKIRLHAVFLLFSVIRCDPHLVMFADKYDVSGSSDLNYGSLRVESLAIAPHSKLTIKNFKAVSVLKMFYSEGTYCEVHKSKQDQTTHTITEFIIQASAIFENCDLFIFDFPDALIAPQWRLGSTIRFRNLGQIWIRIGLAEPIGEAEIGHEKTRIEPKVVFDAIAEFLNWGEIVLKGVGPQSLLARIERTNCVLSNKGVITLINASLQIVQRITGSECLAIIGNSVLILRKPNQVSSDQIIYMSPGDFISILQVDLEEGMPNFNLKIKGFTFRCVVRFSKPLILSGSSTYSRLDFLDQNNEPAGVLNMIYGMKRVDFDGHTLWAKKFKSSKCPRKCLSKNAVLESKVDEMRSAAFED